MLWIVQQSPEGLEQYFALAEREPNFSLVRNKGEVHASTATSGHPRVAPVLEIPDPTFDLDFFEDGCLFVSRRLIDAMALPAGVVSLQETDTRRCAQAIRARGYAAMSVDVEGMAIDQERSDGGMVEVANADGPVVMRWEKEHAQPGRPTPRLAWRDGFAPPADLFRIAGTGWNGATDELAARVLAAGAVGLNFVDVIASGATGDLIVRGRW